MRQEIKHDQWEGPIRYEVKYLFVFIKKTMTFGTKAKKNVDPDLDPEHWKFYLNYLKGKKKYLLSHKSLLEKQQLKFKFVNLGQFTCSWIRSTGLGSWTRTADWMLIHADLDPQRSRFTLKVHKIENFFDSDFGICVISLLVMSKY